MILAEIVTSSLRVQMTTAFTEEFQDAVEPRIAGRAGLLTVSVCCDGNP